MKETLAAHSFSRGVGHLAGHLKLSPNFDTLRPLPQVHRPVHAPSLACRCCPEKVGFWFFRFEVFLACFLLPLGFIHLHGLLQTRIEPLFPIFPSIVGYISPHKCKSWCIRLTHLCVCIITLKLSRSMMWNVLCFSYCWLHCWL